MKAPDTKSGDTGRRKHVLVIDDEAPIRDMLKSYLHNQGFHVTTAATGSEALRSAKILPVDLIILDVVLDDMDGLDLLGRLKSLRPRCPVIVATGLGADDTVKRQALEKGASACVSKTSPLGELLQSIEQAVAGAPPSIATRREEVPIGRTRPARSSHAGVSLKIKHTPRETSETGERKSTALGRVEKRDAAKDEAAPHAAALPRVDKPALQGSSASVPPPPPSDPASLAKLAAVTPEAAQFTFGIEVFLRMLGAYHPNLANTAMRAVVLCDAIGKALSWPENQRQNFLWAAALHDISLVQIEKALLNRWLRTPDKCSKEELALIKRHPERSQRMLEFCPAFKEAGEIILAHHENWDGSGFPGGMRMEMIPWLARLLAVVLFYCGKHTPNEKTLAEIENQANRLYDPQAVQAVVQAAQNTALPRGVREVMASELRPGMTLAGDIMNWDGMLIMGQGTALNNAAIGKILHLNAAGQIEPRILVDC
ncbi:MAG: response regulator [Verrucomicrobia bacterium]|nr:response regulator [Verrucomicrobiota bacterium]